MNDEKEFEEFLTLPICMNCTYFFTEGDSLSEDTYGFCFEKYDDTLEPYIDDIINGEIPDECRELLEKYKVLGGDSCEEFESSFGEDTLEDLPTPKTYEEVISLIADNFDWSKEPVEEYRNVLNSSSREIQKGAVSSLARLASRNNHAAFDMLLDYLMNLVPPEDAATTKFMVYILNKLPIYGNREKLIEPLVESLFKIKSNNQTRGWYTAVFTFLEGCDLELSEPYLMKIKNSKHFSYRIKKKVDYIIERANYFF